MIAINRVTIFKKIVMVVLVLAPILNIYGLPSSYTFYSLLSILLGLIYVVTSVNLTSNINKLLFYGMVWYLLYWGLMTMVTTISLPLAVLQVCLTYILFYGCFDRDFFIKALKVVAIICIVFFFIQHVGYITTGSRINGLFSFLPFHDISNATAFIVKRMYGARSSSFFSEPSHFAQFLVPLFAIELFYDNHKRHLWFAAVIFIVILLLQSGTGIFAVIPIVYYFLLYYYKKKYRNRRVFFGFLTLIIIAIFLVSFVESDMGEQLLKRSDEISLQYEGGNRSGFLRIWRGYFVFSDYNTLEMIFGNPNQQDLLDHVISSGMAFGIRAELYFNAFQYVLLNTGFIGLLLFIIIIRHILKGNSICGKAIIGSLIAIALVEHIYFNHVMLIHLLLAESMKPKYRQLLIKK